MEISEIVRLFREKAAELQKFFDITPRPDVVYEDSFRFARALQEAADILEEKPTILNNVIVFSPITGPEHQILLEWHGQKVRISAEFPREVKL